MESRLDALFKTGLRQTESTDTWLGLRRREEEAGRKKHKERKHNSDPEAWEDKTAVSVAALITFLETLLASHNKKSGGENKDAANKGNNAVSVSLAARQKQASARPSPDQQERTKAVSAYERTAGGGAPKNPIRSDSVPQDLNLSGDQVRAIHRLLEDLKDLDPAIETLEILKGKSLLESLQRAVDRAK